MRERAEAGGGALVLDSAPGGGTTVTLTLPRHAGSGAAA
jgi:signal transduction histidine kinase